METGSLAGSPTELSPLTSGRVPLGNWSMVLCAIISKKPLKWERAACDDRTATVLRPTERALTFLRLIKRRMRSPTREEVMEEIWMPA